MTYLKCALVGMATAVVAVVLWVVITLAAAFHELFSSSVGGLGAVSVGSETVLPVAAAGFALGFYLTWRRIRRRSTTRP